MVVKGSIFIVPNHAYVLGEGHYPEFVERAHKEELANIGVVDAGEEMVQVWYSSRECDNWGSHEWESHPEFFGMGGIPSHLPKSLIENIREGDVLTLEWVGAGEPRTIELRAAQLEFRYAAFGPFEQVLKNVCR